MNILQIILPITFFFYFCFVFALVDTILTKIRGKKMYRYPLFVINAILCMYLSIGQGNTSIIGYLVLWGVLIISFSLCYKDIFIRKAFCSAAFIMHFMAARSIVVSIFSILSQKSIYELVNNENTLLLTMCITTITLCIIIFIVIKVIPARLVRIISQHSEHLWFMSLWIMLFNIYLLLNARVYSQPATHPELAMNQLVAPLVILMGLYVVLFFAMKTTILLGYKEKNQELETEMKQEKKYRDRVMKDIVKSFEFNFTQNEVILGFEEFKDMLGNMIYNYDDMYSFFLRKVVYTEDAKEFSKYNTSEKIIKLYDKGVREVDFEYRRLMKSGGYVWVRFVGYLWKDEKTKEIKAYAYIRDIDAEKKRQIELQQKAERDSLTGLYNKGMTEKKITECLEEDIKAEGVLFIIDVDNFKAINDNLGHTFGDAVLCELADKLNRIFRKADIVGRIGGDEYMVFMRQIVDANAVEEKAKAILRAFQNTYQGENGAKHIISSSIGIAVCPKDGFVFEDLYKNADAALYASKRAGKNTYHRFDGEKFGGYESNRTEIFTAGKTQQKNFRQNRVEYIFKILYDAESYTGAINTVLELVARHFDFDRGYILEENVERNTYKNTFEWCGVGISKEINNLQNVRKEEMVAAMDSFYQKGQFILKSLNQIKTPTEREYLERQGIKSMFQFGIFEHDNLVGFIGFDDCKEERDLSEIENEEIATICNIIATFIMKQSSLQETESTKQVLTSILDQLDSYTYVIQRKTQKVLFMNQKTVQVAGGNPGDLPCYQLLRGKEEACEDCPIKYLSDDFSQKAVTEIYNDQYDLWTETTASHIEWIDGEIAYLVNCTDITKYKKGNIESRE